MNLLILLFLTVFISLPTLASDPFIDVNMDCESYRRLDQPYQISDGKLSSGSMESVSVVDEDIGICYALTASYLIDAWLQTYSPFAVKSKFRTSPIDLALTFDKEYQGEIKRDQAVSGSGYGSSFSFVGGNHDLAMKAAVKNGVCSREKVITETKTFSPAKQNWVLRTAAGYYEEKKLENASKIRDFLSKNGAVNENLLPTIQDVEKANQQDSPLEFFQTVFAGSCAGQESRHKIHFVEEVKTVYSSAAGESISSRLFKMLSADKTGVQPVALSFCLRRLADDIQYDIKNDPKLSRCMNHSSTVMGYCVKKDGKKSFLIREMLGKSFPVDIRNNREDESRPSGFYDDGKEATGNYWVDEEHLDATAKSISWLEF